MLPIQVHWHKQVFLAPKNRKLLQKVDSLSFFLFI